MFDQLIIAFAWNR